MSTWCARKQRREMHADSLRDLLIDHRRAQIAGDDVAARAIEDRIEFRSTHCEDKTTRTMYRAANRQIGGDAR